MTLLFYCLHEFFITLFLLITFYMIILFKMLPNGLAHISLLFKRVQLVKILLSTNFPLIKDYVISYKYKNYLQYNPITKNYNHVIDSFLVSCYNLSVDNFLNLNYKAKLNFLTEEPLDYIVESFHQIYSIKKFYNERFKIFPMQMNQMFYVYSFYKNIVFRFMCQHYEDGLPVLRKGIEQKEKNGDITYRLFPEDEYEDFLFEKIYLNKIKKEKNFDEYQEYLKLSLYNEQDLINKFTIFNKKYYYLFSNIPEYELTFQNIIKDLKIYRLYELYYESHITTLYDYIELNYMITLAPEEYKKELNLNIKSEYKKALKINKPYRKFFLKYKNIIKDPAEIKELYNLKVNNIARATIEDDEAILNDYIIQKVKYIQRYLENPKNILRASKLGIYFSRIVLYTQYRKKKLK